MTNDTAWALAATIWAAASILVALVCVSAGNAVKSTAICGCAAELLLWVSCICYLAWVVSLPAGGLDVFIFASGSIALISIVSSCLIRVHKLKSARRAKDGAELARQLLLLPQDEMGKSLVSVC